MNRNIFFLPFRNANGCGARCTPLKTLLVHPSTPLHYALTVDGVNSRKLQWQCAEYFI